MRTRTALIAAVAATGAALSLTGCGPHSTSTDAANTSSQISPDAELSATGAPATPSEEPTPSPSPTSASPSASPSGAAGAKAAAAAAAAKTPAAKASSTKAAAPAAPPAAGGGSIRKNGTAADITAALTQAKADNKNVLLEFGATWCGFCKSLDKLLEDKQMQNSVNASYHMVQIDIDAQKGVIDKYGSSHSYSLPVLIVLTPDGKVKVNDNETKDDRPAITTAGFTAFLTKWAK